MILDTYYSEIYQDYLFKESVQSKGIRWFESLVENFWDRGEHGNDSNSRDGSINKVLELGAGNGEHLEYVRYQVAQDYVALDIREPTTSNFVDGLSADFRSKVRFVQGNAENLEFGDNEFDRTFSTCLLHHVDDPLGVMMEARRVTKPGGEIALALPTDPGLANRFIKKFVSFPRMSKLTQLDPKLIYALDHHNHIGSLLELAKFAFAKDDLKFHFLPLRIASWNMNLAVVIHVRRGAN